MADRKSSDNTTISTLATGDLIDVLDVSEPVASQKNKCITKSDLFAQIASELALTGTWDQTLISSGFASGYSGSLTFWKLSSFVFFSFIITVSSPTLNLVYSSIPLEFQFLNYYQRVQSNNSTDDGVFHVNGSQLRLTKHGTTSTKLSNGVYRATGMYFNTN